MRRLPPWIWLVLAAVFATATVIAYITSRPEPPKVVTTPMGPVVVVGKEIPPATRIAAEQLKVEQWPQDKRPVGAFTRIEEAEGRVSAQPLLEGEIVLEKKLAPKGTLPGLTALVNPNKRAMTVRVDEASGVAGFVSPDNRVDVVVTLGKGEYADDPISKVVFQDVRVLGTGQRIENRPGDKPHVVPTVTLEVTPEEGEKLALAAQEGRISLVLRGQKDEAKVDTEGIYASQILGQVSPKRPKTAEKPAPAATAPTGPSVEVIRGLQREPVNF